LKADMALSRHGGILHMSVRCCERVIAQIGKSKVVYGHSGGVDTSVVAVPLQRARRTTEPEKSARRSALFIDVFEAEAKKIGGAQFVAQGTLHPDVIETVSLTGGRPGRLHLVRSRQTRSSRLSRPTSRGMAAIAGSSSLRSLTKVR
jgi:GMP synthase PP-ATPase subunit